MSMLRRIARGLELDRIGRRRTWVVRLPHGVHLVHLQQSPLGDEIVLDGKNVAHADPWEYERAVHFKIDGVPAEARFVTDTAAGTLRTDLYVGGELVPAEEPHARPAPRVNWAARLERASYVFGLALVVAGLVGSPIYDALREVVRTAALLLLLMGLRAFDPFGAITVGIDKIVEDRPSMMIAGAEVLAIAALAGDRMGLRRRIPFIRERHWLPRVVGWTAIVTVAFVILVLS